MCDERYDTWQPNRIKSNQKCAESSGLYEDLGLAEAVRSSLPKAAED
jgi:hypothetical protein